MSKTTEIYETVTESVIEAMESGDLKRWSKPWRALATNMPVSTTGRAYSGINAVVLAFAGYDSPVWGTYKAWQSIGCQVGRASEVGHGTKIMLWKPTKRKVQDAAGDETTKRSMYVATYTVFNLAQIVSGDTERFAAKPVEPLNKGERHEDADLVALATGASITHGGNAAYYTPGVDRITIPAFEDFVDSEAYYGTLFHELAHWTGHADRLNRDLTGRFGNAAYAIEELVAEFAAAFTCAAVGVSPEPRADHASYLASWAKACRADRSALVSAASAARKAAEYVLGTNTATESTEEPAGALQAV